jgi:hypothetical protein
MEIKVSVWYQSVFEVGLHDISNLVSEQGRNQARYRRALPWIDCLRICRSNENGKCLSFRIGNQMGMALK